VTFDHGFSSDLLPLVLSVRPRRPEVLVLLVQPILFAILIVISILHHPLSALFLFRSLVHDPLFPWLWRLATLSASPALVGRRVVILFPTLMDRPFRPLRLPPTRGLRRPFLSPICRLFGPLGNLLAFCCCYFVADLFAPRFTSLSSLEMEHTLPSSSICALSRSPIFSLFLPDLNPHSS